MIALGTAVTIMYVLAPEGPIVFVAPGGTSIPAGAIIALALAAVVAALGWQEPRPLPAEAQLLLLSPPKKADEKQEDIEVLYYRCR